MTLINLGTPIRSEGVKRVVFIYKCSEGHEVRVRANSFRGRKAVPGVGAIACPQCDFHAKYPQYKPEGSDVH